MTCCPAGPRPKTFSHSRGSAPPGPSPCSLSRAWTTGSQVCGPCPSGVRGQTPPAESQSHLQPWGQRSPQWQDRGGSGALGTATPAYPVSPDLCRGSESWAALDLGLHTVSACQPERSCRRHSVRRRPGPELTPSLQACWSPGPPISQPGVTQALVVDLRALGLRPQLRVDGPFSLFFPPLFSLFSYSSPPCCLYL